jgi:chemotaxis protein MotB
MTSALRFRLLLGACLLGPLVGCGYSENEWQAQLSKYEGLAQRQRADAAQRDKLRTELTLANKQVADLKGQLQKMGVDLDTINQQLEQTGSTNKQLAKNVEDLQRALKEYQERAAQLERIKQRFELLRDKLKKLTELGLKVEIRRNRMVIRLPGDVLFASGDDQLSKDGNQVLAAVADVIRNDPPLSGRYFQVAGHTDNKPLRGGRFGDNWGLSAMRARRVLLYLVAPLGPAGGGLSSERLHMAGYGDTDPVVKNDTEEGRKQNRRVELVLLPDIEEMLDLRSLI